MTPPDNSQSALISAANQSRAKGSSRTMIVNEGGSIQLSWKSSDTSEFTRVLNAIKLISGREYNSNKRFWTVPHTHSNLSILNELQFKNKDGSSNFLAPQLQLPLSDPSDPWKDVKINPNLVVAGVREYQLEFLKAMKYWNGRGLNGDEMGTGKTCQALSWARYNNVESVLVVTTSSTKSQWVREYRRWCGNGRVVELSGRTPYTLDKRVSCYVINWEVLSYWTQMLLKSKFQYLIGDEVHLIGNPDAKRTKAFQALARAIPQLTALTGTPIRTRPSQFWTILNLVAPSTFPNHRQFQIRYCDPKPNFMGVMEYKGASNVAELHSKIKPIMIRRLKHEVMKELPEKIRTVVPIPVSSTYVEEERRVLSGLSGSRDATRQAMEGLSAGVFALKADGVLKWVGEFLESGRKLVIFVWHQAVADYLMSELGTSAVKINGSCSAAQKDSAIKSFQNRASTRVLVGNVLAAGVGIDGLQNVCSDVAFVELAWSPADMNQAEDRLHRMGQKEPVGIHYLLGEDTIEEDQLDVLQRRWSAIGKILDGKEAALDIYQELADLRKEKNGKSRKG